MIVVSTLQWHPKSIGTQVSNYPCISRKAQPKENMYNLQKVVMCGIKYTSGWKLLKGKLRKKLKSFIMNERTHLKENWSAYPNKDKSLQNIDQQQHKVLKCIGTKKGLSNMLRYELHT